MAFDSFPRARLSQKLSRTTINKSLLWLIYKFYENPTARICCGLEGQLINVIHLSKGVKQGCLLALVLFNLYINDMVPYIKKSIHHAPVITGYETPILLYADDTLLLSRFELGLYKMIDTFLTNPVLCRKCGLSREGK